MSQLTVDTLPSDMFFFHKDENLLSQEISSLGRFQFRRLYDDAIDVGFELENAKTGNATRWYVDKTEYQNEEVVGWHCKPTSESVRANWHTGIQNFKIFIIND